MAGPLSVSVIIPTYLEEETIADAVRSALTVGDEVIVVDAGSPDATAVVAAEAGATVLRSTKGRGLQLDAGARAARGDVLLFLHADGRLLPGARGAIARRLADSEILGGNFRIRFVPEDGWSRLFARADDLRRRWLSIYYGDSALFVRKRVYEAIGGFRPLPIMEDYDLVRRLERAGRTAYVRDVRVEVSARRFASSPIRTSMVWAAVQVLYSSGVDATRLSRFYADVR